MKPEVETHVWSLDLLITEALLQVCPDAYINMFYMRVCFQHPSLCLICLHPSTPPTIYWALPNAVPMLMLFLPSFLSAFRGRKMLSENPAWERSFEFCFSLSPMNWVVWGFRNLNHGIICFVCIHVCARAEVRGQLSRICSLFPSCLGIRT